MKKLFILSFCSFLSLFAMEKQLPEEKKEAPPETTKVAGKKRKLLEEEREESIKEPKFSWELEQANAQEQPSDVSAPTQQELSAFEQLPNEVKELIISFLVTAPGQNDKARLKNAAHNIRNLMMVSKYMKSFFDDIYLQGYLIKELAQRYTKGNLAQAAVALATRSAIAWMQTQSKNSKFIDDLAKAVAIATENNNYKAVNFLLHFRPDQEFSDLFKKRLSSILLQATHEIDYEMPLDARIVERLIASGANVNAVDQDGNNSLFHVIWGKLQNTEDRQVVNVLLDAGADPFARNARDENAFEEALSDDNALFFVKKVLEKGGYTQEDLDRALLVAVQTGPKEIVQGLLKAGANANYIYIDPITHVGYGSLYISVHPHRVLDLDIIKLLIENHANVNFPVNNETPLMYVSWLDPEYALPVMKMLLQAGATLDNTAIDFIVKTAEASDWPEDSKKELRTLLRH